MDKLLLINFSILICIASALFYFISVKLSKDRESEFLVNYKVLETTIELYKEHILLSRINILRSKYDLNEKSPTNSRQAFEKAKNELISNTVKEIIKDYLSKKCVNSLLRYYSVDGLSLLIITHLKR